MKDLQKIEKFQEFPAEVSAYIESRKTIVNLPPFVDDYDSKISSILSLRPFFRIDICFGFSKYDEQSLVKYEFDAEAKTLSSMEERRNESDEEESKTVWRNEKHRQVLGLVDEFAECICQLLLAKAKDELDRIKQWEKICS